MKVVTVFFDFDYWSLDVEDNTQKLLQTLNKYGVKAVVCACGALVEKHPSLIKSLYSEGHEIASHGYLHENFFQLTPEELNVVLAKTEDLIQDTIGEKPVGVRSPWLIWNQQIYDVIERRGYKWVSNLTMKFPEVQNRPDIKSLSGKKTPISLVGGLRRRYKHKKRWESFKKEPYMINGLMEIPLMSTMDGELLSFLMPEQKSPDVWLDYAYNSWVSQFKRSEKYFNLTFHPWLIWSANRMKLLERILDFMSKQDVEFVLAKELVKKTQSSH
jgi:peptidoglycan/xylan/chitin deacetylase (PgdA/CDA1 family)